MNGWATAVGVAALSLAACAGDNSVAAQHPGAKQLARDACETAFATPLESFAVALSSKGYDVEDEDEGGVMRAWADFSEEVGGDRALALMAETQHQLLDRAAETAAEAARLDARWQALPGAVREIRDGSLSIGEPGDGALRAMAKLGPLCADAGADLS